MAKAAKLSFVPPFGGLRGNVHGSSVARRKVRGRLPIIVNWTFFASSHGWGTMSGYWSNLWCCKGGVSLWVLILGGRGSSTNDSWRKNTKSPCAITWWCLRDPTFSRFDTILVLTHPLGGTSDRSVVRSCDPLQNFGAPIISLERLNLKSSNYVQVGYINYHNRMTYHQRKVRVYGHVTVLKFLPFVVMQSVARVCQRQLSYLLWGKQRTISQISPRPNFTKFGHNTSIGVGMKTFGTEFSKLYRKESFFQKTQTFLKNF